MNSRGIQLAVKRVLDIVFALCCSIFAIPIVLISALIVRLCSPESPVIFKQERIGRSEKKFTIYKLRTMTNEKDSEGKLLPDEKRLKTWGKVIRKLSIDELPQILNILAGQMSWIGPRPLLERQMLVMTPDEQKERQSLPPGITGWEAVNESKSDDRREMAEYDLYYVRNWSLVFDAKIFIRTVFILLGASRADDAHRSPEMKESDIRDKNESI